MDYRLFDDIINYPDAESEQRYNALIGLDDVKIRLEKESQILLNPGLLAEWSIKKHGKVIPLIKLFENRHSLFIFTGDVGTGKTTLAESFGDKLARTRNLSIVLFRLSLNARGTGATGEMTRFISQAFHEVKTYTDQLKTASGEFSSACILLIDEADALAQSRELEQMHHEDRAGVDGMIQGIDSFTKYHLPIITVLCTNRFSAIDPAVRRRAAATFVFKRPNMSQRMEIFRKYFEGSSLNDEQIKELAVLSGKNDHREYGYTFSDLTQNLLPALVIETYPDGEITYEKILQQLERIPPTPPITQK